VLIISSSAGSQAIATAVSIVIWITLSIWIGEPGTSSPQLPSRKKGQGAASKINFKMVAKMFRKLALVALASFSIASISAPAFAFGGHFGGGGGGIHLGGGHFGGGGFGGDHFGGGRFHGGGFFRGGVDVVDTSCYRTIWTDFGPRRVFVCD
jgi:hypothetical protein